jgi:hypothetical protein
MPAQGTSPGISAITWPKTSKWKPTKASAAENGFALEGFHNELSRYLLDNSLSNSTDTVNSSTNPLVFVFNSITITFLTWANDEYAVRNSSGLGAESYLSSKFTNTHKVYASKRRHDTVLIRKTQRTGRTVNTMSNRRVAQLLLLFQCRKSNTDTFYMWLPASYIDLRTKEPYLADSAGVPFHFS